MAAFSPSTYMPGDPWTSAEFLLRARTSPKITVTGAGVGAVTPASYFEHREGKHGDRVVTASVSVPAAAPPVVPTAVSVVLEQSFDDGATWEIVSTFTATGVENFRYTNFVMLRLRVLTGTGLTLRLYQET